MCLLCVWIHFNHSLQAGKGGLLLGWVDEMDGGSSNWLRLRHASAATDEFVPASADGMLQPRVSHLHLDSTGLRIRHAD